MTARVWDRLPPWVAVAGVAAAIALATATAYGQDESASVGQGRRMFTEQGCYGCHTVGKMGTPIATDLSHVGTKYSERYLRAWLREPKQQKPAAHMPKIELLETEARALAAYLASLK
jgi:mono/diheme cytochrome c family protein